MRYIMRTTSTFTIAYFLIELLKNDLGDASLLGAYRFPSYSLSAILISAAIYISKNAW